MASYAEYKGLKNSLNGAIELLNSASSKLRATGNSLSEAAVISGKTFEKEAIQNCVNLLNQIASDFSSAAYHCNSKMNELLPAPNNNNNNNNNNPNIIEKGKFESVDLGDFG